MVWAKSDDTYSLNVFRYKTMKTQMEVTDVPFLEQIMAVRTLDAGVPVYENAQVSIQEFVSQEVYPTALYVVRSHLEAVRMIGDRLWRQGINIFDLDEIIRVDGITIAPPVVELSDGVPAIVDGIHRFYLARQLGFKVSCIYIEGASLPLVSYPVNWESVKEYDKAPENPLLRRALRIGVEDTSESLRKHYRDLSLLGSSGRRPRGGQNG